MKADDILDTSCSMMVPIVRHVFDTWVLLTCCFWMTRRGGEVKYGSISRLYQQLAAVSAALQP